MPPPLNRDENKCQVRQLILKHQPTAKVLNNRQLCNV